MYFNYHDNITTSLNQINNNSLQSLLRETLQTNHQQGKALSLSAEQIHSQDNLIITLSKASKELFRKTKKEKDNLSNTYLVNPKQNLNDCLKDLPNCQLLKYHNRHGWKSRQTFFKKYSANFELEDRPLIFLTLTLNTTHDNLYSFTPNLPQSHPAWKLLDEKTPWFKPWAEKTQLNQQDQVFIIKIKKLSLEEAQSFEFVNQLFSQFIRQINDKWKPQNWKWVVVAELQKKDDRNVWHFHLLSTPIVPYEHQCRLEENQTCWYCQARINEFWPWGRLQSKSTNKKTISKYLTKYFAKGFQLKEIYQQYGLGANSKSYRFFKNLYDYEEREAILINGSKVDALMGKHLAPNQHIFPRRIGTYFYRTNKRLVGHCSLPKTLTKHLRQDNHYPSILPLLSTVEKVQSPLLKKSNSTKLSFKEILTFNPEKVVKITPVDFQEDLIKTLTAFSTTNKIFTVLVPWKKVPKENNQCDGLNYTHFQEKVIIKFTIPPEIASQAWQYLNNLDTYAKKEYGMDEAKDFYDPRFSDPTESRNAYLNQWEINYCLPYWRELRNERGIFM